MIKYLPGIYEVAGSGKESQKGNCKHNHPSRAGHQDSTDVSTSHGKEIPVSDRSLEQIICLPTPILEEKKDSFLTIVIRDYKGHEQGP